MMNDETNFCRNLWFTFSTEVQEVTVAGKVKSSTSKQFYRITFRNSFAKPTDPSTDAFMCIQKNILEQLFYARGLLLQRVVWLNCKKYSLGKQIKDKKKKNEIKEAKILNQIAKLIEQNK